MLKQIILCFVILQITFSEAARKKDDWNDKRDSSDKCSGDNEEYRKCGPPCPQTCEWANTNCTLTPGPCIRGCYCQDGYVRIDGFCLAVDEACCPDDVCLEVCADFLENCAGGCYCFQDPITGEGACTQVANITVKCPKPNQVYTLCPTTASKTCADPEGTRYTPTGCTPKCLCADGYLRDGSKNCVEPSCCPPEPGVCGDNETFEKCGIDSVCGESSEPPVGIAVTCNPICVCNDSYSRNASDVCVPDEECDPIEE